MSLKLGNTNIAGTQVLYSTTGSNTDGAMTQAVTTTSLNLKANDADVVHKTSNETIAGEKTVTSKIEMRSTNGSTSPVLLFHIPNVRYSRLIETSNGLTVQEGGGTALDRLYAGSCDAINTVVTTINKSKTENGYFRLGNGLLIQWGLVTNMSNNKATVNYPTPFTAYLSVVTNPVHSGIGDGYSTYVDNVNLLSFNVYNKMYGNSVNCNVRWIAIGY